LEEYENGELKDKFIYDKADKIWTERDAFREKIHTPKPAEELADNAMDKSTSGNEKVSTRNNNGLREPNTSRKSIEAVERSSDVVVVADLHGEMIAFEGNLQAAHLIDANGDWKGRNKKVFFQGDIIADRGKNGLEILRKIHTLREQAQKDGGDIEVIVGNHDDFMISFLTGRNGVHGDGIEISDMYQQ
jgi:hypothetical protein